MSFSTFKVQENLFWEGKIHTITLSLSGLRFTHVLTFMLFLNNISKHVCYDVELKFD